MDNNKRINLFLIIGGIILFIILISGGLYLGMSLNLQSFKKNVSPILPPPPTLSPSPIPAPSEIIPSPTSFPTDDWNIYTDDTNAFRFKYPKVLGQIFTGKSFSAAIRTKTDIIDEYKKYKEGDGCPGNCGRLANDPALLQKQFDLLKAAGNSPNCRLSTSLQKDITGNFILFTGAIGNKRLAEGFRSGSGTCGLKYVESDGYDAALTNFYYKAAILQNDKIVNIALPLFPKYGFQNILILWLNFGYEIRNDSCNASCLEKEAKYIESFNINDESVRNVIDTYDQILSTFQFIEIIPTITPNTKNSDKPGWLTTSMQKAKDTGFSSFSIDYPSSWTKEVNYLNQKTLDGKYSFILSKNNHILSIIQTAVGGGMCLFDGDKEFSGPSADYKGKNFKEFQTGLGLVRKVELLDADKNRLRYEFCQDQRTNYGYFTTPLSIGILNFLVPTDYDQATVAEMDEIVKTIKVVQI